MLGKLRDLYYDREGVQIVTMELLEDVKDLFDELKDDDVEVKISKRYHKRSLDANAYAWVLIGRLAERLNVSKTEVYRDAIRDIGGVSETVCVREIAYDKLAKGWCRNGLGWQVEKMPSKIAGCVNVVLYYGSSSYDTKQMSALIEYLIQNCESVGIPTLADEQVAGMIRQWGGKNERIQTAYH